MNDGDLKNEMTDPDICKTLEFRKEGTDGRTKAGDEEKEDRNTFPTSLERALKNTEPPQCIPCKR